MDNYYKYKMVGTMKFVEPNTNSTISFTSNVLSSDIKPEDITARLTEAVQLYSLPGIGDDAFVNLNDTSAEIKNLLLGMEARSNIDPEEAPRNYTLLAQTAGQSDDPTLTPESTTPPPTSESNELIPQGGVWLSAVDPSSFTGHIGGDLLPGETGAVTSFMYTPGIDHTGSSSTLDGLHGLEYENVELTTPIPSFHQEFGIIDDILANIDNVSSTNPLNAVADAINLDSGGEEGYNYEGAFNLSTLLSNDTSTSGSLQVTALNFTVGGNTTVVSIPSSGYTTYNYNGGGDSFHSTIFSTSVDIGTTSLSPNLAGGLTITYTVTDGINTENAQITFVG